MSTQQVSQEQVKSATLPARLSKFMVYGYWLANQLKSRELINDEVYNTILKQQNMFDDVGSQTDVFEAFLEEFKSANKTMKQEIRTHNKPKKVKKEKVVDPDAPKAKRGRKKKEVEDNLTPEEKLVEEIVSAAHSDIIEKPVEEISKKEIVEEKVEEKVEEPVEEKVEEKPKKVRKSKKEKTEEPVKTEGAVIEEKPKKQTRVAGAKKSKKQEKEPEIAPPTPELKEELKEELMEEEEEEIETTIIVQDGVEYLVDQNNVVYHRENFDEIGVYNVEENKITLK